MSGNGMERLGFIGLGVMGTPMARHLISQGRDVTLWNRTKSKAYDLVALGAKWVESPGQLTEAVDAILICVSKSEDVQAVVNKLLPFLRPGQLVIDHSTILPKVAEGIAKQVAEKQGFFVDAPVTGGSMGANKGTLTIFMGGETEAVERAKAITAPFAKRAEHVGPSGAGQMTKMANQIAVGGALLGLCESLAFAQKAGLDVRKTCELLSQGAAGSWAFENYGPKILARDWEPGFSVTNQQKDFLYCQEAAKDLSFPLPMTELAHKLLAILEQEGRGGDTTAALYDVYLEMESEE